MMPAQHPVFTIGHSTHLFETFVGLLQQHGVTALADVRSEPYSRFNPQFNRAALEQRLTAYGIKYVFLGRELGARSDDQSCYDNGRVQYTRLAQSSLFVSGLERVVNGTKKYHIALMCAEKDPLECHRTLLVARALADRGIAVQHILADGRLESHEAAMERLLDLVGLNQPELFRSNEELIADALTRQEQRVAYASDELASHAAQDVA